MSLPEVFVVSVAFWPTSRHSAVQGEFEETWSEKVVSTRRRAARRKLIKMEGMMSFRYGKWSSYVCLETPFERARVCFGLEATEVRNVDIRSDFGASSKSRFPESNE